MVLPSLSDQAKAERAAMIGQSGKLTLNAPSGSNPSSGPSTPQQARNQELNPTIATPAVPPNANVKATPMASELAIVSGSWTFGLNDSASRTAVLTLFQNGDAVYGTGSLNLDAGTTMTATASGTATGNQVNLDIVSLGKVSLYRTIMTVSGDSATGSYTVYSPGLPPSTGTATGFRSK
jgi:hypothetical protein